MEGFGVASDFLSLFMLQRAGAIAASAGQAAYDAQRVASDLRTHVEQLEHRLDRLTLLSMALGELLIESGALSEAQLKDRIAAIDLRDGRVDGRLAGGPGSNGAALCSHCGRMKSASRPRCIWCGRDTPVESGLLG